MIFSKSVAVTSCGEDPVATIDRLGALLDAGGLAWPPDMVATPSGAETCAAQDWAASGGMALSGPEDGPPVVPRAPVMARLRLLQGLLTAATEQAGQRVEVDLGPLLFGRAGLLGLAPGGRQSANRTCRLLGAADGWVAVNLARSEDRELIPALVEGPAGSDPWEALAAFSAANPCATVIDRAGLVGVPAARLGERLDEHGAARRPPFAVTAIAGPRRPPSPARPFRVVDLSSLWAGPLCAHVLGRGGGEVVKVESWTRPDGARSGPRPFYDLLHAGHRAVAVDLRTARGRADLLDLLRSADVVIEASRPRALRQLGIDADRVRAERPGLTWVRLTGYGPHGLDADRVAFGDDAAIAGGLAGLDQYGDPVFLADALADPIAGLLAATVAALSVAAGGGHLVDVALADAAAWVAAQDGAVAGHRVAQGADGRWALYHGSNPAVVADPPPWPEPGEPARPLGADTVDVLGAAGARTG